MSFDESLLQRVVHPSFIGSDADARWPDIPVDVISEDLSVYCAYYRAQIGFVDANGDPFPITHVTAGMANDLSAARFYCFMEMIERVSATIDTTIRAKTRTAPLPSSISLPWHAFSPYDDGRIREMDRWVRQIPDYRVAASGMVTGRRYDLPALSVFPWWYTFLPGPGILPETEGVGTAAGFYDQEAAIRKRALYELLERDALMISWRVPGWPVRTLPADAGPSHMAHWAREQNLSIRFYEVGDPRLCSVVMAILSDRDGQHVTIGGCSGKSFHQNLEKSLSEAIMLRGSALLLDPKTPPFADDEIDDSEAHVLYAWRNGPLVIDWYERQASRTPHTTVPPDDEGHLLDGCRRVFGCEPMLVNLTEPRLAMAGYRVVRVMLPGVYKKEYKHTERYLGGARLKELGVAAHLVNPLPHPVG
jgi:ribosomal protein S12 methylthiotransferase accessory factor YcaO